MSGTKIVEAASMKTQTKTKTSHAKMYGDKRQRELYKRFPPDSFLGNEQTVAHFLEWVTFFRRNLHRLATDYFGWKLHLYQIIMLYLMGISQFIVIIASRACAKSFIIAMFSCCKCVVYPKTMIVLTSATKGQSKLLVSEKIQKELMNSSPMLRREILRIKDNQHEVVVYFRNHSTITVVPASDNGRGYRSTIAVREEFRQIKKSVDDGVISPFQIIRQTPYMMDEFYENIEDLQEESVDVYISSSWIDNGHWMWDIVDQTFDDMLKGAPYFLLAFDESIPLKHKIKTMKYFQREKKKQDPLTWRIEFLNERVKENEYAFFTYAMLQQNQRVKKPFYPRTNLDVKTKKKNPYNIPKQKGEIRLVSCDMAFIENKKNDNSIFTCMRLLPDSTTYNRHSDSDIMVNNGYRRVVPYMESVQGGDTTRQALRIRQLFEDFGADYIVLDLRNAGISIYDMLARIMYDDERDIEYSPLTCMNDDSIAKRIKIEGANPCIFVINATQTLNSNIAMDFRRVLIDEQIDLLVSFETACEEVLPNIKEYTDSVDLNQQIFFESPFLETQAFLSETTALVYEKKEQTGAIVIKEQGANRKDRYTSVSYGSWFASALEKDLISANDDYEYTVLIN